MSEPSALTGTGWQGSADDLTEQAGASPAGGSAAAVAPVELERLREELAEVVLARDGVLRIEPTLVGMAQSLAGGAGVGQHLRVTRRNRVVDISANVAVRADRQARTLAHRLRADLVDHLVAQGLVPGIVEISVLAIEPVDA